MARERLSEVLRRLNASGEYATFMDIATTLRLPQQTYHELSDDLQQGLDFLYKAVIPYPPCPSCSSSDHIRFRYFNNSYKSRISLQPRFECYFRRPSAAASPPPFDYPSASNSPPSNSSSPLPTCAYPATHQHPCESSELSVNSLPLRLPAKRGRKPKAKRLLASDNGVTETPSWNTSEKPRLQQQPETSADCKGFTLSLNEYQEHLKSHGGLQFLIQRALNIGEEIPLRRLRQKRNSGAGAAAMEMDPELPASTMVSYSSSANIVNPQQPLMNVAGNADPHVQSSGYGSGAVYPQETHGALHNSKRLIPPISNSPNFVNSASSVGWYNQCFRPGAAAATVMPFNSNYVVAKPAATAAASLAANPSLVSSANSAPILGYTRMRMTNTDQQMSGNVSTQVGYGQIPTHTQFSYGQTSGASTLCYGQPSGNTDQGCHGPAYIPVNAHPGNHQMSPNTQLELGYNQMSGNPQLAQPKRHDQILMTGNTSPSTLIHEDQMSSCSNTQFSNDQMSGNTQLSYDQTSDNYRQLSYDQTTLTGNTQLGYSQISGNPQLARRKRHDKIMSVNTSTQLHQLDQLQMSGNTRTQLRHDQLSGYDQMSGDPQLAERHDQTTGNKCIELQHGQISNNTQLWHGQISSNAQQEYGQMSSDEELGYDANSIFRHLANHSIYSLSNNAVAECSDSTMATHAYVNDVHPHGSDGTLMSVVDGNAADNHDHSTYPTVNYNHHDSLQPSKDVIFPDSVNYTETTVTTSPDHNYNYDDDCLAAIMSELEGIIQSDKQDTPNDVYSVDQLITNGTESTRTDQEELIDGVATTAMANTNAAGTSIGMVMAAAGASAEADSAARASADLETAMVAVGVSSETYNSVIASTDTALAADGASVVMDNAGGASTDTDNASATTTAAENDHLQSLQDQNHWIVLERSGKLPVDPPPTVGFPSVNIDDNLEGDGGFPDDCLFEYLWDDGFAVAG